MVYFTELLTGNREMCNVAQQTCQSDTQNRLSAICTLPLHESRSELLHA